MNIALWGVQGLVAAVFGFSALIKGTQSRERAISLGMTGVANVPLRLMRFIALAETLGVLGLFVPYLSGIAPVLTPLAAAGLGAIMIPAARIHAGLGEPKPAVGNMVLLAACLFIAWGRWPG